MATSFDEIYDFFAMKVRDYSFLTMDKADVEEMLEDYLTVAISKFKKCTKNLSDRDKLAKSFNVELSDEEKDILSLFMVVEYLKPSILDAKHKRLALTDKEFGMYSQSNHLKEISNLYKMMQAEVNGAVTSYSYNRLGDKDE